MITKSQQRMRNQTSPLNSLNIEEEDTMKIAFENDD